MLKCKLLLAEKEKCCGSFIYMEEVKMTTLKLLKGYKSLITVHCSLV